MLRLYDTAPLQVTWSNVLALLTLSLEDRVDVDAVPVLQLKRIEAKKPPHPQTLLLRSRLADVTITLLPLE